MDDRQSSEESAEWRLLSVMYIPRMRFVFVSSLHYSASNNQKEAYLFLIFLPNFQLFLVWETYAIHALETIIVCVTKPIGSRVSCGGKGLDLTSMCHMRPTT